MQTDGNINGLKENLEKKYSEEIKKLEKELNEKISEIEKETERKLSTVKSQMDRDAEAEAKVVKARILNEGKLAAKREFEEKREELIESVFREVKGKIGETAQSQAYLDFVKKMKPRETGLKIEVGNEKLKGVFPEARVNKELNGVKFKADKIVYDFSLDGMIESEREATRRVITKNLFE